MDAPTLTAALRTTPLITVVHVFPTLDSTNSEASRQADRGAPHGTLIVADEQTAGRGRAERRWLTPSGTALASTLLLRHLPTPIDGRLALLGGLAVAQAIETHTALTPHIKWPNDVWIDGQKVAGVLVEPVYLGVRLDHVLIGIGVNVNGHLPPLPTPPPVPPTTLAALVGHPLDRAALLIALWQTVADWLPRLTDPAFRAAVEQRLLWRGQIVTTGAHTGTLLGLAPDGGLRLAPLAGPTVTVYPSADHLRPA